MVVTPKMSGPIDVRVAGGQIGINPASPFIDPALYQVNVPEVMEQITQPLYSYQLYPAGGTTNLAFFTAPAGGTVSSQDTNMTLASQLPAPQMFLIQGIGVDYLPGTTAAPPTFKGAATANGWTLDFYTIFRQGYLTLTIGTKNYFQLGPLMSLPPRSHLQGSYGASDSTTAGAAQQWKADEAWSEGPVFAPTPMLLEAGQNFAVNILFPNGAVPTVSTDALARIGVILYGTLFRPAQ